MQKRRQIARMLSAVLEPLEARIFLTGSPVTSYADVPLSAMPTLPAKYGQFTDPDFGTRIIRVTDATDGNENHNEYSYYPALNKDNTHLHITRNGVESLYTFNPATMAINYVGPLFAFPTPGGGYPFGGSIWSANNAEELICFSGSRIFSYNVATPAYTLIKDFAGTPGWSAGDYIWQLSRSMDDNTFAFTRKDSGYQVLGWQVWRNTGGAGTTILQSDNTNLDEVQVDKTGNWLVEKFGDSSGDNIWNLSTGTSTFLTDGTPDYSPDHSDNGSGVIVAFENWQNNTTLRNFATPHTFTNIFVPPPANEGGMLWQSGHISMLADDEAWVTRSSQYAGNKTGPFLNELFLVATDGSGRVIRMAHHRTDATSNYWHNSFPSVSRDGRFTVFTSNMGNTTRSDVFILRNPIPGDANMDYSIDQTDCDIWAANQGASNPTWAMGDWDADHDVDNADYQLWVTNSGVNLSTVTVSATDNAASEAGLDSGTFRIARTGPTTSALSVYYAMSGMASNTSGTDYTLSGTWGTAVIAAGSSYVDVTLTPVDDSSIEGSETAVLTISANAAYRIGSPGNDTVIIADNDIAGSPAVAEYFTYGDNVVLNGQGTAGNGWAGAWSVAGDGINNVVVLSAGLTAPVNLQTQAGSVTTGLSSGIATRSLSRSLGTIGSSLWTSFLIKPDTSYSTSWGLITIGNTQISYGKGSDGIYRWNISAVDGSWYGSHFGQNTNPVVTSGETYFLVVQQVFNGGSDSIFVWINPTPGAMAPSIASASESKTGVNAGGSLTSITLKSGYFNPTAFDELRIGTSYADVAPVAPTAPTVTAVYVRGSTWNTSYLSFLAANMSGSSSTYGYAIPVGTGASQLQTLPWRNLNQISLCFSGDVSIAQAQFAMVGSVGSYSVSGFSYSSIDHVATWSLSAAIGPDKLYVALPGSGASPIADLAGNVLDGEWVNPSSYSDSGSSDTFPSGNGSAGGDFAFRFDVLPGDSTGGSLGKVNVADALQTKSRSGLPVSTSTYRSDFDGNNLVNVADVLYVKGKSSVYSLPVNPPVVPVFGVVYSQVNLLQRNRLRALR